MTWHDRSSSSERHTRKDINGIIDLENGALEKKRKEVELVGYLLCSTSGRCWWISRNSLIFIHLFIKFDPSRSAGLEICNILLWRPLKKLRVTFLYFSFMYVLLPCVSACRATLMLDLGAMQCLLHYPHFCMVTDSHALIIKGRSSNWLWLRLAGTPGKTLVGMRIFHPWVSSVHFPQIL